MGVRFSDLTNERKTVAVPTRAGTIEVTYRPNELTPAREEQLADLLTNAKVQSLGVLSVFTDIVVSWDLTGELYSKTDVDEDGHPVLLVERDVIIPILPENLYHVSTNILVKMFTAIQDDMNDDPKAPSRNSGGGSFSRAK